MTNQEAIIKLTNIMHDDHYSWHPSILTAFCMAVDALRGAEAQLTQANTSNALKAMDCISRAEAIDAILHNKEVYSNHFGDDPIDKYTIAIIDNDAQTIAQLPSAQPEHKWIPVTERLPEDGKKHYWVCTDTGYQCECRWTNINHFWTDLTTNWHWHIMDIPQYSAVIAWMPLPEPARLDGE